MCFHFCTTYKWIDNHCVLLNVVTSSTLIVMKGEVANATLVAQMKHEKYNKMIQYNETLHVNFSNFEKLHQNRSYFIKGKL